MPSLQSIREAARRAQSQRVQQRLTARTPQNAQRRARAEQERAATKKWGHWGRELPPKHKERHLQIAYLYLIQKDRRRDDYSPSPRRRAPRVNEDRLLSAEERHRDSVAQIIERSQHELHSILSTEEAQAFLGGVELSFEYMNNFAQSFENRGQPVVATVAIGFAIASSIGVVASIIVLHTSNIVFQISIRTLQILFSSWYKAKRLLIFERPRGVPFQKIQFGNERGGRSVLFDSRSCVSRESWPT